MRLFLTIASLALLSATLSACVFVDHPHQRPVVVREHEHKHGPPSHAPAHGYRKKHGDVDLVFDSGVGVYVVVDLPHHYWDGHRYLRWTGHRWESCERIDGVWVVTGPDDLPSGLAHKYHGKDHKAPKAHGPPAKHDH